MARIRVARELSTTQLIALKEDVKRRLLAYAAKETGKSPDEFVVRDILAGIDLGFGSEKWDNESSLTSVTWTNDWSKELPKTKFVAFYGFINHTDDPLVIGTKFKVGSTGQTVRDIVMHGRMRREDNPKCFFEPVLYKGQETIYVEHYNESGSAITAGSELLEFIALVAEPYGAQISKPLPH